MSNYPDDMSGEDWAAVEGNASAQAKAELESEKIPGGDYPDEYDVIDSDMYREPVNVFNGFETIENIRTGDNRPVQVPLTMVIDGEKKQIGMATTTDGVAFEVDIDDEMMPHVARVVGDVEPLPDGGAPFSIAYLPGREAQIVPALTLIERIDPSLEDNAISDPGVPKQYPLVAHLGGEIVEIGFADVYESGRIIPTVTDKELADICRYSPGMPEWLLVLTDDDGSGEREVIVERNPAFAEPKNVADTQRPAVVKMGVWDGGPDQLREYAEHFTQAPTHFLGVLTTLEDAIANQKPELIMPAYLRIDELFKVCATRLLEVAEGLELMAKESGN